LSFNVAATAYHKRKGWNVSAATINQFYRGWENYQQDDHVSYTELLKEGSVFVTPEFPRTLSDFGWPGDGRADGFDWNHIPGVTAVRKPRARFGRHYGNQVTPIGGGTALEDNGVWGMENTGERTGAACRKSMFFFGDRITSVITGIESNPETPAFTTLYQQFVADRSEPVVVNGEVSTSYPMTNTVGLSGKPAWLIDRNGTGYYLHAMPANLRISKRAQSWLFMSQEYLKEGATMEQVMATPDQSKRESFFNPTTRDYHLAYLEYTPSIMGNVAAYTIVPQTDSAQMKAFSAQMESEDAAPYAVLRADNRAHVLLDRASETTGYVIFEPMGELPEGDWIRAASRFCYAMVRRTGEGLTLSIVADPRAVKGGSPVRMVVEGNWKVVDHADVTATPSGGQTLLSILNAGPLPLVCRLTAVQLRK
jgi:chondroitin-sulfate-ABC endolyase/exolyase